MVARRPLALVGGQAQELPNGDMLGRVAFQTEETTIASAATVNLGAVNTRAALITGTTTITSFGTAAYREVLLRFAGALTLTHSASLALQGGASLVTAAGDTALAVSDGSGNWLVLNYVRAAAETPWLAYTPSVGAASGAIGSYTTSGAYKVVGKTVFFRAQLSTSDKGNAAGALYFGLPLPNKGMTAAYGVEDGLGNALSVLIQVGQSAAVVRGPTGGFPMVGAGPWAVVMSGSYETT